MLRSRPLGIGGKNPRTLAGLGRRALIVSEKNQLGTKHECEKCGGKYYDFGKPDKPCPLCGATPGADDAPEEE